MQKLSKSLVVVIALSALLMIAALVPVAMVLAKGQKPKEWKPLTDANGVRQKREIYTKIELFLKNRRTAIHAAGEAMVLDVIRSPKTATFEKTRAFDVAENVILVSGEVTSQNAFGALLTTEYNAWLNCKFDGEKPECYRMAVKVDGEPIVFDAIAWKTYQASLETKLETAN